MPVLPDAVPREIVFPLAGSGWIRCEVHPAESAPLLVAPGPFIARTGADGAFLIAELPAGAIRLGVFHAGRVAGVRRLRVVAGTRTDGSIEILPAPAPGR